MSANMNLDPNKWTHKTREAFQTAAQLAATRSNPEITNHHLLSALISQQEGIVLPLLQHLSVAPASLRNELEHASRSCPQPMADQNHESQTKLAKPSNKPTKSASNLATTIYQQNT